jgi:hypothetical protein
MIPVLASRPEREKYVLDWVLDGRTHFVTTGYGDPTRYIARLKDAGVVTYHQTDSLDEALEDLLMELRVYVARFFEDPSRYMAGRRIPPVALLQFALSGEDEQRSMLGIEAPAERELVGAS